MKKTIDLNKSFPAMDAANIPDVLGFVESALSQLKVNRKLAGKTALVCEETLVMLLRAAPEGADLQVQIRRFFGDVSVVLSVPGSAFDPYLGEPAGDGEADALDEDAIRAMLLRSHGDKFKYRNRGGVNQVRILTGRGDQTTQNATFLALGAGLLLGLLVKLLLPQSVSDGLCTYLLEPVRTVFLNALKIVIAPLVFFSMATCFSQFKSFRDFGKLGIKVLGVYFLTTLLAIGISLAVFYVIQPGTWGFALTGGAEAAAIEVETDVEYGILPTLINIVPSNFLRPFLEADTLQLMFLAVLCGAALGMIGQYSAPLKNFFEACGSLFQTIMTILSRFIPYAAFASVCAMVIRLGGSSMLFVLSGAGTHILALLLMFLVYALLILCFCRLNPLTFYKKTREGMVTSFTLSSSAAAIPTNMRICTEKLGISSRVANFSIPLGATVNMDGVSSLLVILSLFLARAYGIEVPVSSLAPLLITVVLLSLGSPGVPGAGFVCLGIVLSTIHVPIEALGLIIAINPIMDMCETVTNTTGDVAAALIAAKSEKLLDESIYRK